MKYIYFININTYILYCHKSHKLKMFFRIRISKKDKKKETLNGRTLGTQVAGRTI